MNKREKEAQEKEAKDYLYRMIEPGAKIYTVLNSVSTNGMSRHITALVPKSFDGNIEIINISYYVARLLGYKYGKEGSVVVGGCGMDMGFHLVNSLSIALFGFSEEAKKQGRELKNQWL